MSPTYRIYRFLGILAFILVLIALHARFYPGRSFVLNDLVFVALIASSLFLDVLPLLLVCLIAAFLTNWQSGMSFEIVFTILFPLVARGSQRLLQLRPAAGSALFAFISVTVLYATTSWNAAVSTPSFFIELLAVDVGFAILTAFMLEFLYGDLSRERSG
jgi:hypothetical protein